MSKWFEEKHTGYNHTFFNNSVEKFEEIWKWNNIPAIINQRAQIILDIIIITCFTVEISGGHMFQESTTTELQLLWDIIVLVSLFIWP